MPCTSARVRASLYAWAVHMFARMSFSAFWHISYGILVAHICRHTCLYTCLYACPYACFLQGGFKLDSALVSRVFQELSNAALGYIVIACIVMAYTVMAYIAMAYIVMPI